MTIKEAVRHKPIKETGINLPELLILVGELFPLCGQITPGSEDLIPLVRVFAKDIKERFDFLSLEEISIALNKGIRKDYGSFYGICNVTLIDFLNQYTNSQERKDAISEYISHDKKLPIKSFKSPRSAMKDIIVRSFYSYRDNGSLGNIPIVVYDCCIEVGILNLSKDKRLAIWNEALQIPTKLTHLKEIENFRSCESKKIALRLFFDDLVASGLDIKKILS